MIMLEHIVKMHMDIMTCSTKICLSSNNANNKLISVISDILSSLIRLLGIGDYFKWWKNALYQFVTS